MYIPFRFSSSSFFNNSSNSFIFIPVAIDNKIRKTKTNKIRIFCCFCSWQNCKPSMKVFVKLLFDRETVGNLWKTYNHMISCHNDTKEIVYFVIWFTTQISIKRQNLFTICFDFEELQNLREIDVFARLIIVPLLIILLNCLLIS